MQKSKLKLSLSQAGCTWQYISFKECDKSLPAGSPSCLKTVKLWSKFNIFCNESRQMHSHFFIPIIVTLHRSTRKWLSTGKLDKLPSIRGSRESSSFIHFHQNCCSYSCQFQEGYSTKHYTKLDLTTYIRCTQYAKNELTKGEDIAL